MVLPYKEKDLIFASPLIEGSQVENAIAISLASVIPIKILSDMPKQNSHIPHSYLMEHPDIHWLKDPKYEGEWHYHLQSAKALIIPGKVLPSQKVLNRVKSYGIPLLVSGDTPLDKIYREDFQIKKFYSIKEAVVQLLGLSKDAAINQSRGEREMAY